MAARALVGFAIAALIYLAPAPPPRQEPVGLGDLGGRLAVMERKVRLLAESNAQVMDRYRRDVLPIKMALLRSNRVRDPMMARLAAWAIVRETETRHLSPELIASIIGTEDPWLVPDTLGPPVPWGDTTYYAVGWMQVMEFHANEGGAHREACGPGDLTDGNLNVCYGANIFRAEIGRALDRALRDALCGYGGFVKTPGCEQYATRILARLQ